MNQPKYDELINSFMLIKIRKKFWIFIHVFNENIFSGIRQLIQYV